MEKDTAQIILENEGLIYKIASYFKGYSNIDDLYQAGCMGIINGIPNYDETKNTKFSTYIYSYIYGEMKKLVREDKAVKVSRDITRLRGKILEASDKLSQVLMRTPTDIELCEFLDIEENTLAEALNSNIQAQSLDESIKDTNLLMHEVISSPNIDYDELLYLKTQIESLEEPERTIMINRYYEDMTQSSVAKNIGLSQVDVSRRESKVLSKIKAAH